MGRSRWGLGQSNVHTDCTNTYAKYERNKTQQFLRNFCPLLSVYWSKKLSMTTRTCTGHPSPSLAVPHLATRATPLLLRVCVRVYWVILLCSLYVDDDNVRCDCLRRPRTTLLFILMSLLPLKNLVRLCQRKPINFLYFPCTG